MQSLRHGGIKGMLEVNSSIRIPWNELSFSFVRSSGPGGQHVNKTATAVQLRFDTARSGALPESVRGRLRMLAGKRMNAGGVLVIDAREYKSQERNRARAIAKLIDLIRRAARKPAARRKTAPSSASIERRLNKKRRRSVIKARRKKNDGFE
jgi:ribosome-associated protein